MAKKSSVSLKDLISRQRELAAAGDANAAKQLTRLEDLAKETKAQTTVLQDIRANQPAPRLAVETEKIIKQDRILQVVQTLEARKADKDDDRIAAASESLDDIARKGLLEKTGDGLNANVLNLLKVMSKFTSGVVPPAGIKPPETRRESTPERIPESQRGKQGATGYAKQQLKSLAIDRVSAQGEKGRLGAIGYAKQEFKKLGTLSGWINTSSGKGQGLLGQFPMQAAMRLQAKNDFIKDQLATGATTNKDLAGKRFDKVNDLRLEGGDLEKEVAGMRERGLSEAQIERTGVVKKQQAVDEKIAIANPLYREIRAAETNAVVPVRGKAKPAEGNTPAPNNSPLPELSVPGLAAPVSPVSPAEQSAENLRLMVDQTESIKQIALNTQPIGDILNFLQGSTPKQDTQSAGGNEDQGDGILDMLPGKGLLRKGGQILRRVGKGIVGAGRAIASRAAPLLTRAGGAIASGATTLASRAAPILSQAGSAIASGASNIASKAAPVVSTIVSKAGGLLGTAAEAGGGLLSKVAPIASNAGGFLGKAGGLAKGILGKAALPLAAGMAVYDGVTGYRDAAENLGIEGREATTGEKASSAAGSVVSGLTFGLLDKKTASKGIASFFGAGPDKKGDPSAPKAVEPVSKEQVASLTPEQKQYREASAKKAEAEANFKKFDEGQVEGKDYKYKTAMDEFTDKRTYSDPKKQEEFEKLKKQRYEADTLQQKAVASRMEKDGVLGEKRVDPKAPRNLQENQKTEGMFKDTDAKLAALEKSGYERDQFISKDPTNYVQTKDGKKYDKVAIDAVYNRDVQKELAGPDQAKTVTPRSADAVYNKSGENAAIAQQAAAPAPVVINAPSTSSVQQTQNYAPMSPPRNTESSLQQYNRSRFAF